jgi:hypothetical protein
VRSVLALSLAAFASGCAAPRPAASPPVTVTHDRERPAERTVAEPARPAPQPVRPRPSQWIPPPPGGRPIGERIPAWRPWSDTIVIGGAGAGEDGVEVSPTRLNPLERYGRKSDYWSPCVRDFVQTQPEPARVALGEALSLYSTSCSGAPARRIELQTPPAARMTQPTSHLGLVGALEPTRCELALTAAYHGEPVRAERIVLISDGQRWSSPRILFAREDGWETATLTVTRSLARVVQQAIAARDTVLRFEGARDYQDVAITDDMKQDLRIVLDALDAISCP